LTIAIVTRIATVEILPSGSQLWQLIQHMWSTGTAEVATRAGKFA